jgi:response regulator RpfG family c-di-GMP phosphodiesterase
MLTVILHHSTIETRFKTYSTISQKLLRKFIKDVFDTAPLHDIGKVGIKDSILLKAGTLTNEEFEEMKKHVLIGRQVIQDIIDKFDIKESFIMTARNIVAFITRNITATAISKV